MYKIYTNFSNKYYFVELKEILIPSLIKLCTSPRRARETRVVNLRNNAWRRGWSLIKTLPIQDPRLTKFHVFRVHRYLDRVCQPRSIALLDSRLATVPKKSPGSLFLWIVSKSLTTAYSLVLADSRLLQEQVARGCENGRFPRAISAYLPRSFTLFPTWDTRHEKRQSRRIQDQEVGGPREDKGPMKTVKKGHAEEPWSSRQIASLKGQRCCFFETVLAVIPSNLRSVRPREFDHEIRYLVYL